MKKFVDGVGEVELTPQELAEWEADQALNRQLRDADNVASVWRKMREDRDALLRDSDIRVLPDRWAVMSSEEQANWTTYRQALRDLPATTADPSNPVWPAPPAAQT